MQIRKEAYFIIAILFYSSSYSQTRLYGTINAINGDAIPSASLILKDSSNTKIIKYAFSDINGKFSLILDKSGSFFLNVRSLGYQPKTKPLIIDDSRKELELNIVLEESVTSLDEIIIKTDPPILVRKDTITFKTKFFKNGTEQTVEDLLKKIPGLNIDDNGTIKVGNQEIEKLMIDGDDLFERGYKLLSKNMPAYPIDEVEILKRYSNNRLLKDIEESNKVALNLKLDEKSKRIWFGNIEASYGNDNFYQLKANLMNFGKKNKYYLLSNLNNIGYDATGDINQLIRPYRTNEAGSIGDNQQLNPLLNLSATTPNFKQSRTNFNNAELLSINAIFNLSDKLKLKTLGFFNWDEKDFFRNATDNVNFNGTNFTNTEDYKLRNKNNIGFGKLDLIYNISKTKMLEATTKYNNGNFDTASNLVFNGNSTLQTLDSQNTLFDQSINYTNKFKDKKVILLTGRFIDEQSPQNYTLNRFFYEDILPNTNANSVTQQSTIKMQYAGVNAHLIDRKKNNDILEFQLGNNYRKDKLNTTFTLFEDANEISMPNDYQNNSVYSVNDLYFKSKYRKKIKDFAIVGRLDAHQLFNRLENAGLTENENLFFINPGLNLDWKINEKNKIITSYSFTTTNAGILGVYSDFVLTGFRSFNKGTGDFNQLQSSGLNFNYQLGNWSDRFFANIFALYSKNHDFFSTNSIINQNFVQTEKILIKDREFLSINSKIDYYFKFIKSNLKLNLGYSKSEFKNIVNNSNLRTVTSNNYSYGFELRSGFNGIFNYHFGTSWSSNSIETAIENSFTDNTSFLDLSFVFNKKLNAEVKTERYLFGNLQNENTYYFLDFDLRYQFKKDKLTLALSGKNLFNTETFRNFSLSDVGSSTTEYRLLPRFVLAKIEYRF